MTNVDHKAMSGMFYNCSFLFCLQQPGFMMRDVMVPLLWLLQYSSHCACVNILHPPDKSHLSNLAEEVCEEALYL